MVFICGDEDGMKIRQLIDEDFVNYKKPSMFIGTSVCDWKCCNEQGLNKSVCQNSSLSEAQIINIPTDEIFRRYINNPITKAVVLGGLEPMLQFEDVYRLIWRFRNGECYDDFVIYTGYYKEEIMGQLLELSSLRNVLVKYGRFIPNQEKHYDDVLGVYLASHNQYAERIC